MEVEHEHADAIVQPTKRERGRPKKQKIERTQEVIETEINQLYEVLQTVCEKLIKNGMTVKTYLSEGDEHIVLQLENTFMCTMPGCDNVGAWVFNGHTCMDCQKKLDLAISNEIYKAVGSITREPTPKQTKQTERIDWV